MNENQLREYMELRSKFSDLEEMVEKHLRRIILDLHGLGIVNFPGYLNSVAVEDVEFDNNEVSIEYTIAYRGDTDYKRLELPLSLIYGEEAIIDYATRIRLQREIDAKNHEEACKLRAQEAQRINRQGTLEAYRNLYQLFDGKNPDEVVL